MLGSLLQSLGEMTPPPNCDVSCLIVENDTHAASLKIFDSLIPLKNGIDASYVLETELGIPFGRNRAAKEAILQSADLLAFIDDDEFVASDWLLEFVARYRETDAVLLGGPVVVPPAEEQLTWIQRVLHRELVADFERRAAGAIPAAAEGRASPVTNNWLGEVTLFSEHQLWFDESLRLTGGSDSQFFHEARARGFKLEWASKAQVYAPMSKDRLTLFAQIREAHGRTINRVRLGQTNKKFQRSRLPFSIFLRLLSALLILVALPFRGGKGLLKFAQKTGWITGRIYAAFGGHSSLYARTFGN